MTSASFFALADALIVGVIVLAAVAFLVHRYAIKRSGGCSCGSCACQNGKSAHTSCGCPK
ncbi:MAG: hypothetical protein LBV01_05340 [Deltaproteobacteria bacterium]|jgi:hypothetical protein|nr:hypothetical protein [Deltaproteobacteria bacterium]